jgi:hypothetical protein
MDEFPDFLVSRKGVVGQCKKPDASKRDASVACKADEFTCGDGQCIPDLWDCDGINDCDNKFDEENASCKLSLLILNWV